MNFERLPAPAREYQEDALSKIVKRALTAVSLQDPYWLKRLIAEWQEYARVYQHFNAYDVYLRAWLYQIERTDENLRQIAIAIKFWSSEEQCRIKCTRCRVAWATAMFAMAIAGEPRKTRVIAELAILHGEPKETTELAQAIAERRLEDAAGMRDAVIAATDSQYYREYLVELTKPGHLMGLQRFMLPVPQNHELGGLQRRYS